MNVPSSPSPIRLAPLRRRLPARRGWPWFLPTRSDERSPNRESPAQPQPVFALARPRRLKRSARSVLLWSLGFYALAILALNLLMDRWCPAPFEKVYRIKWEGLCQWAREEPDRPLLVMLGSSRTDGAFQAGRLNGIPGPDGRPLLAFNFGVPAAGPMHEYQYLRDMLDEGIRPRLLLVEFLPPLFNEPHSHLISEENWAAADWMSLHQYVRLYPYLSHPGRKASEWIAARVAPWYVHRFSLHGWVLEHLHPPEDPSPVPYPHDEWGCRCPEPLTPQVKAARAQVAREYMPSLNHFRLGQGPTRAMRDLLECCRREQIPVALVLTPESTTFRGWYQPECLKKMRDLLDELRETYSVEVIDATHWLNDDDFMDGHHHDISGAAKFTARMSEEVQRLLRRQ